MGNTFCCERFQFYYTARPENPITIRVIDLPETLRTLQRPLLSDPLTFLLVSSYIPPMRMDTHVVNIRFCPFCGEELKRVYSGDDYLNEKIVV